MQPYTLVGPDELILKLVGREPGIPVARIADRIFPAYAPSWSRERVRRLALVGLIRIEGTRFMRAYPVEADA